MRTYIEANNKRGAHMAGVFKATLMTALLLVVVSLGMSEAKADPVIFDPGQVEDGQKLDLAALQQVERIGHQPFG